MRKNIYQIAREAGVSTTTVSRVINGEDGVGAETKKLILNIINKSDFTPRISTNKNTNIGIFLGSEYRKKSSPFINSPYMLQAIDGLGSVFFNYDYNMMLAPIDKVPKDKDDYKIYCYKHNICAGIFINICTNDVFINDFADTVPTVTIGTSLSSPNIITVRSNNFQGSYDVVSHLIEMGHHKIVFLVSNFIRQDYTDRREGYRKALEEHSIAYEPEKYVIEYSGYSQAGLNILIEKLLTDSPDKPTAFFICNDREVIRFLSIINELGLKIPNDVSIVGFDDYEYSEHFLPPLTTVKQPIFEMGCEAAILLLEVVTGKCKKWGDSKMLGTKLMIRKSVKNINL